MEVGEFSELRIARLSSVGAYLCDQESEEVLLPKKFLTPQHQVGEKIRVFITTDSEDRLVATTQNPYAKRGEFAVLKIQSINDFGCFLDIGLDKDLFMPSKNPKRFKIGEKVCVFITLDRQKRMIAKLGIKEHLKSFVTTKDKKYIKLPALPFENTPLGIGCIVDQCYYGLIYHDSLVCSIPLFTPIQVQIIKIRKDGKLDLKIDQTDTISRFKKIIDSQKILNFHYDSSPEEIRQVFQMSKKLFKKTLTMLIRQKYIKVENNRIYRINNKN